MHFPARRHHVGAETLMVLHVTRTFREQLLAFKFIKQVLRVFPQSIDQDIPDGHGVPWR